MLDQLLPPRIDNTYRGHKLALLLFALVVAMKTTQSLLVIFNGYAVMQSADGIPLDIYTPSAAQTVVALGALSGLSRLIIFLLCALVLARYRSAIPFMFALLLFYFLAGQLILRFLPIASTGTPPGPIVNLTVLALTVIGLALALWNQDGRRASNARAT